MTGRRGRRCRKLLDYLKERRGYSHLKEEALDHTMWRTRFVRDFGPVVRQAMKRMNNFGLRPLFHEHNSDINQGLCMCVTLLGTFLRN